MTQLGQPSGWPFSFQAMTKIIMLCDLRFAHRGVQVVEYTKGQEVDTEDAEFIALCAEHKWGREASAARRAPSNKAHGAAPEAK